MEMPNLSDGGDVISACISKDFFMKAPDESCIMKDFPENATEWIATGGKGCTDVTATFKILLKQPGRSSCSESTHLSSTINNLELKF